MKVSTFELQLLNEDGSIKDIKNYRSIREMSKDINIPYHNLKVIFDRGNKISEKYKNTVVNNLSKILKINLITPTIEIQKNI
mgnify:CR=1 FL=1